MKRSCVKMLLYYLVGSAVMVIAAWLLSGPIAHAVVRINLTVTLLISLVLTLLALLICLAGEGVIRSCRPRYAVRHCFYRVSYFMNSAASGITVGAIMAVKKIIPSAELLLYMLPIVILALGLCVIQHFPSKSFHKAAVVTLTVVDVLFVLLGIWVWLCSSASVGCVMVFHGLFFLLFPVGARFAERNPEEWYRYLSYTGFGAFALIFFAAIVVLSDGDALEFLDVGGIDFDTNGTKKKK